jgi:hypothetical protein
LIADHSWRLATSVLTAYDGDGYLGISVDEDGTEGSGNSSGAGATPTVPAGASPSYEVTTPGGLLFRHLDPTIDSNGNPNAGASGLTLMMYEGGRGYGIPLTDPRTVVNLPPLGKGDCILYGGNGTSCVRIVGSGQNVGRLTLFTTTDGTPNGASVYLKVWPDSFGVIAPWGNLILDANAFDVSHISSGTRFTMGGIGGLPGPAAQLSSFAVLQAASISLRATMVKLGAAGPQGYWPVEVQNPEKLEWYTELLEALALLATAVGGFTGTGTFPALPAAVAAIAALAPPVEGISATAVAG